MCFAWLRFALLLLLPRSLSLSPCDNKTKQNLRLDGSYDGGVEEVGVGEVGSSLVVA